MQVFLQIILAICIVVILFVIAFAVYNSEYLKAIRNSGVSKERVEVFSGVMDLSTSKDFYYDTVNASSSMYRKIGPSYNQAGGIEYTYNFWLYVDSTAFGTSDSAAITDAGFTADNIGKQTILFVKGSKKPVNYTNLCNTIKTDIMVKSPLVKLEENGKYLTVEFNILQGYDAVKENSPAVCTETSTRWELKNAHKFALSDFTSAALAGKWNMITVVLQDTYPQDELPYRNKVRCRVYINTLLELDKYADGKLEPSRGETSTLKTNDGHLYIAPNVSIITTSGTAQTTDTTYTPLSANKLMLANLTYFNYATTQSDIDNEFAKGVTNKASAPTNIVTEFEVASKSTSIQAQPIQ